MKRCLAAFALALLACPAAAAGDSPWTLRFHGAVVRSSGRGYTARTGGASLHFETGTGGGIGGAVEYRLSNRIGIEISILLAGLEAESTASSSPPGIESLELSMVPLTVGVPFHFRLGERTELRLGPALGHVSTFESRNSVSQRGERSSVEVDSVAAIGAALGLERRIGGGGWAFGAGLRHLRSPSGATAVDPWIATVGFAYRF